MKRINNVDSIRLEFLSLSVKDNRHKYKDIDGYLYSLSDMNLKVINRRNSLPARFFRNNSYTLDNIKLFLSSRTDTVKLVSDNVENAIIPLDFVCSIHGAFSLCWNVIKNGQLCSKCGIIRGNNAKRNNFEDVLKAFSERGFKLISTEYRDNDSKLSYICLKHEEKGMQQITWGNFISSKGCKYCGTEKMILKQTKSHSTFVSELFAIHDKKYVVKSLYVNSSIKVDIYCDDCNTSFSVKPYHLLSGHMGCNCRSISIGEDRVRAYLDVNNIVYEQQYRFTECRNIKPLPFDFAIFTENGSLEYLIEFNGKQHYENTGWTSDKVISEKQFIRQKLHDQIKRDYCSGKGIKLIEIPYWDINKISEILAA